MILPQDSKSIKLIGRWPRLPQSGTSSIRLGRYPFRGNGRPDPNRRRDDGILPVSRELHRSSRHPLRHGRSGSGHRRRRPGRAVTVRGVLCAPGIGLANCRPPPFGEYDLLRRWGTMHRATRVRHDSVRPKGWRASLGTDGYSAGSQRAPDLENGEPRWRCLGHRGSGGRGHPVPTGIEPGRRDHLGAG